MRVFSIELDHNNEPVVCAQKLHYILYTNKNDKKHINIELKEIIYCYRSIDFPSISLKNKN
jgi:hypothetical protein